jgi:hypothetical protein
MPQDNKYGKVTLEKGTVGEDEPVVVFRAQDKILPVLMNFYFQKCREMGSPQHHLDLIMASTREIIAWQAEHFTKLPTSDAYAPQQPADAANPGFIPTPPEQAQRPSEEA